MKSKCTKSSIPSFLSCSTTVPRLERRISGYVLSCISFWYAFSVGVWSLWGCGHGEALLQPLVGSKQSQ